MGPEFIKDAGKTAMVVEALYGLSQEEQLLEATFVNVWRLPILSGRSRFMA